MDDSAGTPGVDVEQDWDSSSDASTPRSATSTSTFFPDPDSPASSIDTEMSFPDTGPDGGKHFANSTNSISIMPNQPNHIVVGQNIFTPGRLRAMRDELAQARRRGEFPSTASTVEDPKDIVEDYRYLQRLREIRGDLTKPPPEKYTKLRIEITRRIKTRDEAEGGSTKLEEMDNRVQSWMGSINKEARMMEITQAALQRKGISNPTQADLDAIAEEFMQIAERTLLDVANPLRMNTTRLEGNVNRFDSQLNGLSDLNDAVNSSMTAQVTGLSDLNSAVNTSMSAQVNTLNTVLTNLQANMSKTVGASAEAMSNAVGASAEAMNISTNAMSTAMASQLSTLNTMLSTQSSTFDGSLNMLNTSLNTVTSDLQKLTASLPGIIAAATQAAIQQQLANTSHQHAFPQQHQVATEAPPSYIRSAASIHFPPTPTTPLPVYYHTTQEINQDMSQQDGKRLQTGRAPASTSRLRRFFVRITRIWGFKTRKSQKEGILA